MAPRRVVFQLTYEGRNGTDPASNRAKRAESSNNLKLPLCSIARLCSQHFTPDRVNLPVVIIFTSREFSLPREALPMPKFELGQVVATPGALSDLRSSGQTSTEFLHKRINGDWGEVNGRDIKANAVALRGGGRLVDVYQACKCKNARSYFELFANCLQCG